MQTDVLIAGGGLTGLALATALVANLTECRPNTARKLHQEGLCKLMC